jgi:hypothetical protein
LTVLKKTYKGKKCAMGEIFRSEIGKFLVFLISASEYLVIIDQRRWQKGELMEVNKEYIQEDREKFKRG